MLAGGTDGELAVRAVHGVARLERDHTAPRELGEVGAELSGRVAERDVVKVLGRLDRLHAAADVELEHGLVQVRHGRVRHVVRAKDRGRLERLVGAVDVRHCQRSACAALMRTGPAPGRTGEDGERGLVARVAQGDAHARRELE